MQRWLMWRRRTSLRMQQLQEVRRRWRQTMLMMQQRMLC